jgi:hypothetical protein
MTPINRLVGYSCQPEAKAFKDFRGLGCLDLVTWRWFNYIPIGFRYCSYVRSDRQPFDIGLLGSAGRDYGQIDVNRFQGKRFLFVGGAESAVGLERLREMLDVTVVSRVDDATYARLLSLCRCIVVPAHVHHQVNNVFLSVPDTIASAKPLMISRHAGIARLERDQVPAVFYDATPLDLVRKFDDLFRRAGTIEEIAARSIEFAKEKLDVYRVLTSIVEERVV